jgi:hypothetical protein
MTASHVRVRGVIVLVKPTNVCISSLLLLDVFSHGFRNLISIYLSIYGSTALVDLGRFFSFLIYTKSVRLLGRGISLS